MILRTAKSGNNIGSQFWGCSRYPYCKAIVNVKNDKTIEIEQLKNIFNLLKF